MLIGVPSRNDLPHNVCSWVLRIEVGARDRTHARVVCVRWLDSIDRNDDECLQL